MESRRIGALLILDHTRISGQLDRLLILPWKRKNLVAVLEVIEKYREMVNQNRWRVIFAIIVLVILIWTTYVWLAIGRWPDWTGFGEYIGPVVQPNQTFQPAKTLWDLMQLLIIPAILAGGAYWLNESARKREQAVTEQRTQETALQTYLDKMTELLLKEKLRKTEQYLFSWDFITENPPERLLKFLMQNYHIEWVKTAKVEKTHHDKSIRVYTEKNSLFLRLDDKENKVELEIDNIRFGELIAKKEHSNLNIYSEQSPEVRDVARARTLTVLRGLDGNRKGALLRFLYEADLIGKDKIVINLNGADLREVDLRGANLRGANLSKADMREANLSRAILIGTNLSGADMRGADMSEAYLRGAILNGADMRGADMSEAYLRGTDMKWSDSVKKPNEANLSGINVIVDLSEAKLIGTNLSGADMRGAYLRGADMSEAYLRGAILSGANLSKANLSKANLRGAKYTKNAKDTSDTIWPEGFDPAAAGANHDTE